MREGDDAKLLAIRVLQAQMHGGYVPSVVGTMLVKLVNSNMHFDIARAIFKIAQNYEHANYEDLEFNTQLITACKELHDKLHQIYKDYDL